MPGAKRVDIVLLRGGRAMEGAQPCAARSHHGFAGQDQVLVQTVTGWLRKL